MFQDLPKKRTMRIKISLVASRYSAEIPSGENTFVDLAKKVLENSEWVELTTVETTWMTTSFLPKLRAFFRVATGFGRNPLREIQKINPEVLVISNLFPNWSIRWIKKTKSKKIVFLHNFRTVCAAGTLSRAGKKCTLCIDHGRLNAIIYRCYKNSVLGSAATALYSRRNPSQHPLIQKADALVAVSDFQARQFLELGVPAQKLAIMPNPVTISQRKVRNHQPKHWLWAGRLSAEKAIVEVLQHFPSDHSLIVAGDGPLLPLLYERYGRQVTFTGRLFPADLAKLMRDSYGLIFSSASVEGLSFSYLEALALGIPTISNLGNSVANDIISNRTGMVISNWLELPSAMNKLLEVREQLVANCLLSAGNRNTEKWAQSLQQLCRQLIKDGTIPVNLATVPSE